MRSWAFLRLAALALSLGLSLCWLTVRFVAAPAVASWAVRQAAERYQVRVEVGSWRFDLVDTVVEGRNVSVAPLARRSERGDRERYGAFRHDHLMDVGKIEVDFGLDYRPLEWLTARPLFHLAQPRKLFERVKVFHVLLSDVRVNVERRLPSHFNWETVFAAIATEPEPRGSIGRDDRLALAGSGAAPVESTVVPVIQARDMNMVWIDQFEVDGPDGGAAVGEQTIDLRVEDLELRNWPIPPHTGALASVRAPVSFRIDGRLGEGVLQADGDLIEQRPVMARVELQLGRVGLASLWRDQFGIAPVRGRFSGQVELILGWGADTFEGRVQGTSEDLQYASRLAVRRDPDTQGRLGAELARVPANRPIDIRFRAPRGDLYGSVQQQFGRATLEGHPVALAELRRPGDPDEGEGLATTDPQGDASSHASRIRSELAAEAGRRAAAEVSKQLGDGVGAAFGDATEALALGEFDTSGDGSASAAADPAAETVDSSAPQLAEGDEPRRGNAVTRGLKKVGRVIKKPFTGRKKRRQEASPSGAASSEPADPAAAGDLEPAKPERSADEAESETREAADPPGDR